MSGKVRDLTGQVFGKLTARERDLSKTGNNAYWLCSCICGNPILKSVRGSHLTSGNVTSCGKCLQFEMIGRRFGRLTVLEVNLEYNKEHNLKNHSTYYKVKCDCGSEIFSVSGHALRTGRTKSCGCLNLENHIHDLTNQIFGYLKVLYKTEKRDSAHIVWHVVCLRDGNEFDVRGSRLVTGEVCSCGCIVSVGEANIQQFLQEKNIQFEKEKTFEDLISDKGGKYRYDFYLPEYNRLIEFDGKQHYSFEKSSSWNTVEKFEKTQQSDKIKNEYALSHNIPLVRIPYWERDNITLETIMEDKYLITNIEDDIEEEIIF